MRQPLLTSKLQGFGTTIFAEMTALAQEHGAVNLGQGFPSFDPPPHVAEAAVRAIQEGHNQYAPGIGLPLLRDAIAQHQQRFYGLAFDPLTEITVTAGATEAIAATILALCETGDEVVVFEPYYDSYSACIALAGAVQKAVTLTGPDFTYDPADLEAAVTDRTRLILLNTPHNPTGKVWSADELAHLAALAVERDVVVVADEVYEHLVFDGVHTPITSLPGMRERTVTISSAGKTFSVTGWKTGWICAAAPLTAAVRTAKQFLTFTNGTPFQVAVTTALLSDDVYFTAYVSGYLERRERMVGGLRDRGLGVTEPQGTYFATLDIRSMGYDDGLDFCRMLPAKVGVAAIPCQVFYSDPRRGRHLVRLAFCKSDAEIDEGVARLAQLGRP